MAPTLTNTGTRKKLGQLLCDKEYLSDTALEHALAHQEKVNIMLGEILVDLGYITLAQLNEALSQQAGIGPAGLENISIPIEVLEMIPAEVVSKYNILPMSRTNGELSVAMVNPFETKAIEDVRLVTGCKIRRYYSNPFDMERAVLKYYGSNVARMLDDLAPVEKTSLGSEEMGEMSTAKLHELAREPSLVNLVNLVILEAIEARASDVHIEPFENQLKIKYRIDGMLVEKSSSPIRLKAAITSRIKIMGNMNIAERFIPQDGHIEFGAANGKIDLRVSTVPTVFGESITMRILDRSSAMISLEDLGMNNHTLEGYNQCLHKTHGIVLVTGPTGSGKTTTLYASLNKIYSPSLKIITIEDPVEYQLDGIIQMPVNP
ncbi:MAG: Flp pilus assembly complex ATPase component TadA, partial [Anaerohalosphaera sp.]|nr:Flp pilus assembly complex ATPase component TadA [Anaerohalosphaera sp.]